ncbi:peptidase M48 Ste24p [Armatimonadetes bacterium Uphvl-Ar1]|nr:peptidase M48 Ste24p [Armatimonadetes bacterium Uphvl-Ar1]
MGRPGYRQGPQPRTARRGSPLIGLVIAIVAIVGYFGSSQSNPVTGESQRVNITADQEIALGLQAAPHMAAQYGGQVTSGPDLDLVQRVGQHLAHNTIAKKAPYTFEFHLLADTKTVNAFALPGGQIFITRALFNQLETEGQLAGVLGHEIGHVIERHGAEHMAKQQLTTGLTTAVATASDSAGAATVAQAIGSMLNMKYGRDDELESDEWGIQLMVEAGYDPRALIGVMQILEKASGGSRQPEFASTHPSPENRIGRIEQNIKNAYPNGLPTNLRK